MKTRRFKIGVALATFTVIGVAAYVLCTGPTGDAQRYAELHRLGASYKRAWTGQPSIGDRFAALIHFSSPSTYYHGRFEQQQRALVASGYMTNLTVPVPNLRPKVSQVWASLTYTFHQTGAYAEASFDHTRDEVRLVCRKEDITLWQRVLKEYQ
jgi:hypothetical protein